jgi:hypothetical protein
MSLFVSSGHVIRIKTDQEERDGWARSTYGVKTNAYRVLVGNPEGRSTLGRPWNRWEK